MICGLLDIWRISGSGKRGGLLMSDGFDTPTLSLVTVSNLGAGLTSIFMADDIQVGSSPSYELCKLIYLFTHLA